MKLGRLVRDPTLLPKLPRRATVVQEAENKGRADFLLRRASAALAAHPAWKGSAADEVKDANASDLKTLLGAEVTTAAGKLTGLRAAMADTTKTALVPLDDASIDPPRAAKGKKARFRERYKSLLGLTPEQLRDTAIVTAAWTTLAGDPAIPDADLHTLVSRRLMMTERMLWYIGSVGSRSWGTTAGKWNGTDGWERMFEYPRLPSQKTLNSACNAPSVGGLCDTSGALAGWTRGEIRLRRSYKVNADTVTLWNGPQGIFTYEFYFNKAAGNDPAVAVQELFKPYTDFRKRNLLMCDHTIHCLHLESLVRVHSKKASGDTTWFRTLVNAEADGWLRITYPSRGGERFLVSSTETRLFERKEIDVTTLEIGDHAIIYNHPAYDMAKDPDDVWRLENALVVATYPRLLLQGHGTNPLPFTSTRNVPVRSGGKKLEPSMRLDMLGLFNAKLRELRTLAIAENRATTPRSEITLPSVAKLVQRSDVGPHSGYDPGDYTSDMLLLARWWIRWNQDPGKLESTIAADSAWAAGVWQHQKVELTGSHGYFPLWLPRLKKNGQPVRNSAGKIKSVAAVRVGQEMAPGWDWYYKKGESPRPDASHRAAVRRPKVS